MPALGAAGAIPPGLGIVEGGPLPYQPAAAAKKKENFENRLTLDPEIKCYLPGVPRAIYMPYPFQILQTPEVHHDGPTRSRAPFARSTWTITWRLPPTAGWDGRTGAGKAKRWSSTPRGSTGMTWFDRAGNFHSDALHVVERFTAASPDHLLYEATIEDPKVFTRPWKISMPLYRRVEKNAQIMEFKCVEFVEDLIYGHLRKQTAK